MKVVLAILVSLLTYSPLFAQVPAGNYRVEFVASSNHSTVEHNTPVVERYELLVSPQGSTAAPTVVNLGKPTPNSSNVIVVDVNTAISALSAGNYVARVRAVGQGGQAESPASAPFSLGPRAPTAPSSAPTVGRGTSGS